jgi:tetratricopeptide (TPR) repeat protein
MRNGKLIEAEKMNKEALRITKIVNFAELIFDAEMTSSEIKFRISETKEEKNCVIESLKKKSVKINNDLLKARIYSKLGLFYELIENYEKSQNYRKYALKIYKKQYRKTPVYDIKNNIKELEKLLN